MGDMKPDNSMATATGLRHPLKLSGCQDLMTAPAKSAPAEEASASGGLMELPGVQFGATTCCTFAEHENQL